MLDEFRLDETGEQELPFSVSFFFFFSFVLFLLFFCLFKPKYAKKETPPRGGGSCDKSTNLFCYDARVDEACHTGE